jgi:DNA-binding transcriptional MerR regulator
MDGSLIIPGPRTKAALALLERHRRRGVQQTRHSQTGPKSLTPISTPQTARPLRQIAPTASTIREVSLQLGLTMRAIRLYEEMGLIACGRGTKNMRTLDETAKATLRAIVELKSLGLAISEIAELAPEISPPSSALRARLADHLAALDDQRQATLAYLARLPAG